MTPQLSGNKRKRELISIAEPTGPFCKKPRISGAPTSTAGGSNGDSGVEGLLLGQHITSNAAKSSKLSPSASDERLEILLQGRAAGWHSGSDTDEMILYPRTTGKQRDETEGPSDYIIDLGKPKPNPRGRTPSGSTSFSPIADRVQQFEQASGRVLPYRDQRAQPPRRSKVANMQGKVCIHAKGLATR